MKTKSTSLYHSGPPSQVPQVNNLFFFNYYCFISVCVCVNVCVNVCVCVIFYTQMPKLSNGERGASLTNGVAQPRYQCIEERNEIPLSSSQPI